MIQYLIAGLVGGAVALAQKPKKMERGGRLDEEDIKDRLYDMGVDYEDLMENAGLDLDAIQDQYLGFIYDPDTNTWGRGYDKGGRLRNIEGGRIIMQQGRSYNTYAEPVSDEVEQSAKEFVYRLDALFEALSLPHVKTYGWNGSSLEAVGSYDIFIEKGDDYDPETRYILGRDYHDAIEKALKFMCDLTGAKLEEYDRESPDAYGSVATIDIDAMVEAHNQERAKLRERFGFAHGGRVSTYDYVVGGNPKKPFDVLGRKDGMVMYHTSQASVKDSADKAEELLENGYDEVLIAQP